MLASPTLAMAKRFGGRKKKIKSSGEELGARGSSERLHWSGGTGGSTQQHPQLSWSPPGRSSTPLTCQFW